MVSRMVCTANALGFRLGIMDTSTSENILESFHLRLWGGNGLKVPYYIYTKNGTAYHL